MPDYKKKKVRRVGRSKGKSTLPRDIPMQSGDVRRKAAGESGIKVVKGNKLERRRKFRIAAVAAVLIAAALIALSVILPVGLMENITNLVAVAGVGDYPYEIYGSEILNTMSRGNYYYVLTDTNIIARANSGKNIFTHPHGFSNPALAVSETRVLVYGQGGADVNVYNLSKQVNAVTVDGTVITADVARSGHFAVAYEADTYASKVDVFDKNGKKVFTWNSARELVTAVTLAPSGKKLAVSTLNVNAGKYTSSVRVFGYDSANPVFTKEFPDDTVLSLESVSTYGFSVLTSGKHSFVSWRDYTVKDTDNELQPAMYRSATAGSVIVYNRSGDRSDNRIVILSKKGEKVSSVDFDGIISDITYAHGHIYCISDTNIYMLDKQGNIMRSAECDYGGNRIAVTGTYSVAVVYSGKVRRIELKGE